MLRRVILAASLLLSCAMLSAQTVDFTGVTISTSRVKKVYQNRFFVLGTGAIDISDKTNTGLFGARFGWVQRFGVYGGVEMGVGGIPVKTSGIGWTDQILFAGKRRDPRLAVSVGGIVRLASAWNLYAGCSMLSSQTLQKDMDGKWWRTEPEGNDPGVNIDPAPEIGVIAHLPNHLSFSLGGSVAIPASSPYVHVIVRGGVGYNF